MSNNKINSKRKIYIPANFHDGVFIKISILPTVHKFVMSYIDGVRAIIYTTNVSCTRVLN